MRLHQISMNINYSMFEASLLRGGLFTSSKQGSLIFFIFSENVKYLSGNDPHR